MLKIENAVAETLLIPLYMKYIASQQPEPIVYDETALRLVPQLDYDFSKFDQAVRSIVGTALRARYFDRCTADFIHRHPDGVVVVIGCGLAARCRRIGQAAQHTRFYQLDLPEVIALRGRLPPPQSNETLLVASAFEHEWMDDVRRRHPQAPFLFVIEGVLMYFPKTAVRQLLADLARRFSGELLFDVGSSWMVRNSHRHDALKYSRARLAFGCDDDREMEDWAPNLHLVAARYPVTDFPEWKRIGWVNYWLMRLLPVLRRSCRLLHYRIAPAANQTASNQASGQAGEPC